MFRMVVQESRLTPTSGKVVALLGSYDPHAKTLQLDKEKATFYLEHGAQPSDRAVHLMTLEGIKMPSWVTPATEQKRAIRNPEKLRKNQPKAEEVAAEPAAEAASEEAPAEETASESAEA